MNRITATEQSYVARQQVRAFSVSQLVATHRNLTPVSDKCNSLIAATKNIRTELKSAYPLVKFSVRSSRFSGGDSIDVSWTDGPTCDQVEEITNRYEAGSFDGMTDCYNYDNLAWTDAFGDAKYIHTRRDHTDAMMQAAIDKVYGMYSDVIGKCPTVWDVRQGLTYAIQISGYETFQMLVNRELSAMVQS